MLPGGTAVAAIEHGHWLWVQGFPAVLVFESTVTESRVINCVISKVLGMSCDPMYVLACVAGGLQTREGLQKGALGAASLASSKCWQFWLAQNQQFADLQKRCGVWTHSAVVHACLCSQLVL